MNSAALSAFWAHVMPMTIINSKLDEQVHFAIFRGYFDYEECMQPIVRTCPEGVHRVYEVENEWHKLVEIANYQCNSALTGRVGNNA